MPNPDNDCDGNYDYYDDCILDDYYMDNSDYRDECNINRLEGLQEISQITDYDYEWNIEKLDYLYDTRC